MPRLLVLLGSYRAGHSATGPNQSFRALAKELREENEILVVATDPNGTQAADWHDDGYALVRRLRHGRIAARGLRALLRETSHDMLLVNSFYDRELCVPVLLWRKLGLIPRRPLVLSPRGEFAAGALSLKAPQKRAWLAMVRTLGLTRDIWFHATADHEVADIEQQRLPCRGILKAPNACQIPDLPCDRLPRRRSAPLRIVTLSRITPVKNLHFALDVLSRVSVPVHFEIYGPVVDPDYATRLRAQIATIPNHVQVHFAGPLPHDEVTQVLGRYDLFFMPTMGENFGHAINEALGSGVPALIADTTPWRGLAEASAGWDLPLDAPERFVGAIEAMAKMAPDAAAKLRAGARALAERRFVESDAITATKRMIDTVLERNPPTARRNVAQLGTLWRPS